MIIDGNKYIHFKLLRDTGKTQVWECINKSSDFILGSIQWYGGWRQYTFIPSNGTEYNNDCLETITKFIDRLNKEKRLVEK